MEYDIVEYLVKHKDGIMKEIAKISTEAKNNPILKSFYSEAVTTEVIMFVAEGLNLSFVEVALVIDKNKLEELFGKEFYECL